MAEPETYVVTRDIKAAVQGRETDVLDGLGIDWRRCTKSNHIRCPYPEHGSDGENWRWDARKAKAFCTCNPGHSDSVLDVAMKCDGLDIEGAKIRVAEIINRPDLVKTKGGSGKGGQRTDAVSLLNPPAGAGDAELPQAYLAHRLGIDPADVLMPTTACVGWKAASYWEAPEKAGGKPVEVGQYPCAVFGTVAADGGMHAHRIFVAPGGAGKADLGTGANGKPRDPKKSAKAPVDGASTAGRSVMWGSAGKAPHVIVTEGIETGAAVAHAFRREIEAGEVTVAAAISAGGVAAWQPWPATKRVTVAADRDEARKPSRPEPTRAGEKAAREFGLRRQDEGSTVEVRIALPGVGGTATDWLDVMVADGADAVRTGIEAAARFVPTQTELRERAERAGREAELERIATLYPVPTLNSRKLFYDYTDAGQVWLFKEYVKGKGEHAVVVTAPIASPFAITHRLRVLDDGGAYGLRLLLQDMDGRPRAVDIERKALATMGGAEARGVFLEAGVRFEDDGELVAVQALKAAHPVREISVVRHPGWHDIDGARIYVTPGGEIIGRAGAQDIELSVATVLSPSVSKAGSLEGWKAAAAAAIAAPGVPHFTLGLAAAFAGALVDLCALDSCGVNLSGGTSAGKTTAQRLAASAWSVPESARGGLFQTAKTTANGFESLAARANGTVFALDELALLDGKETAKCIYTLASGVGKVRLTAAATVREPRRWRTFAMLSNEMSLEAKIRAAGEAWTGGQAVRVADVDVGDINRLLDASTFAKISAVSKHYGWAGPAFVRALVEAGTHERADDVKAGINTLADRLAGPNADSATRRAARPFAILLMAGGMAQQYGLLPTGAAVQDAVRWAWAKFTKSSDAVALDPTAQAVGNIRQWIAERWRTSLHGIHAEEKPTRDAVGWWDDDAVYLTPDRLVEAAGGTLKETAIAKALSEAGMLEKTKSTRNFAIFWVPKVGKLKAYALSRDHFGRGPEVEPREGDGFKSYAGGRA